jgi:anti-sigma-K factor RskA
MIRSAVDEKIAEQAAMYALGILSQSEACLLEYCLNDGRQNYAEELAAFDAVVTALALSAPEKTPPAEARKRLLDRIAN